MSRPISRKRAPGSSRRGDAFARGQFARAMLFLDALRAAAFAQFVFEMAQRFDEMPHVSGAGDGLRGVTQRV